ncbi:MAG: hypothetical protein LBG97_09005 [Coriobacteriales bacterium]|nr:hypothetical protein [Coriobacteriales bacterium]
MAKFLNMFLAVFGLWLVVSPLFFGYETIGLAMHEAAGILILILAIATAVRKKDYKPVLNYFTIAIGLACIVMGIVSLITAMGFGANAIIVGVLIIAFSLLATLFKTKYSGASFYDDKGVSMLDLERLGVKDGNIVLEALLLQRMPSAVHINPEEVWKILTMIPPEFLFAMPKYLYKGYKLCKMQDAAAKAQK